MLINGHLKAGINPESAASDHLKPEDSRMAASRRSPDIISEMAAAYHLSRGNDLSGFPSLGAGTNPRIPVTIL